LSVKQAVLFPFLEPTSTEQGSLFFLPKLTTGAIDGIPTNDCPLIGQTC